MQETSPAQDTSIEIRTKKGSFVALKAIDKRLSWFENLYEISAPSETHQYVEKRTLSDLLKIKNAFILEPNIECTDQLLDPGNGCGQVLGHGLAVGLVLHKIRMPGCRCLGVEGYADMRGLFVLQQVVEGIGKPQDGRGVQPLGIEARRSLHGEKGTVNKRHAVEEEEFFHWYCFGRIKIEINRTGGLVVQKTRRPGDRANIGCRMSDVGCRI